MAKRKNSKSGKAVLDVPVEFGGVSIGENTARLGIRMDRSVMNLLAADEAFCGHRLNGSIVLGGSDDARGQGKLLDDMDETVTGTFDVKRIGVNSKSITTGLTFSLADIDIGTLARFSKGSGRLIVNGVSELPVEVQHEDEEELVEA